MRVKDPQLLKRLMDANGISARQLSAAVGWGSHSLLNRIIAGQVESVKDDRATRIAEHLRVPTDLLFVSTPSSVTSESVQHRGTAA